MEKELNSINFENLDKDIDMLLSNISDANELYKRIENTLEELGEINYKFEEQDNLLKTIGNENIDAINKNSDALLLKIAELIEENNQLYKKIDANFSDIDDVLNKKFNDQQTANSEIKKEINNFDVRISNSIDTNTESTINLINDKNKEILTSLNVLLNENKDIANSFEKRLDSIEQNNVERQNKLDKKLNILLGFMIVIIIVIIGLNMGTV